MDDQPVVLRVLGLTKVYGSGANEVHAVRGVSLDVHAGELVAMIGPSGSGKTTLLAMLGGLLTPTSGQIYLHGRDLARMSRRALARVRRESIGFVFQAGNLIPYLTARENIEVMAALTSRRSVRANATKLVEDLGLFARADALATELSGGERQRVAIARALVNQPALLLVDEPTANLDSARGEQVVRSLLSEVHGREIAGILVTHDLAMARIADRVLEMRDGKLSELSTLTASI